MRAAGPRMDELRGWLHFRRAADVHVDPVLGQADREVCLTNGAERDLPKTGPLPKVCAIPAGTPTPAEVRSISRMPGLLAAWL